MEKRRIDVQGVPKPQAPYSVAVAAGNLLFVSGQVPIQSNGKPLIGGTFEEECRLTLDNLKAVLEGAGSGIPQVVKVLAFLADMDTFAEFNGIYKEYFGESLPARSCIQAGRLPLDFQVEVEAIAILPDEA